MKRLTSLFFAVILCLSLAVFAQSEAAIVIKDGCTLVVPKAFSPDKNVQRWVDTFVQELQKAFEQTLGFKPPIVEETSFVDNGQPALFLGNTAALRQLGIDATSFENFNGVIATRGNHIFIAGNDRDRLGRLNVGRNYVDCILGTVKAGVVFMEDYLKVRFVLPGAMGIDYLPAESIAIPGNLTRQIVPKLIFATGRNSTMLYQYSNNNFGCGSFYTYGGHSYYDACPAKVYGKSHPEYFILRGGKRDSSRNHLCISNPEVQELIYQEALKKLDMGAETVQVAQTDGFQPCECNNCKAFANTDDFGEKLWVLHRSFADRLLKDRPGKKLHIICYGPTEEPPKSFREFPDNVIIELCHYDEYTFAKWKGYRVKQGFTVYIYNWGFYQAVGLSPKTTPEFCASQIRFFLDNHVRGIYRCGFGELWGLEGPSYYVYGKMLDDETQNHAVLAEEFYRRCFGKAQVPMHTFFETLHERLWSTYLYVMLDRGHKAKRLSNYPCLPRNPRVLLGAIYTPDLLQTMEANLSRAEKLADTPAIRARLKLVRMEFEYVKNLGKSIAFYNAYQLNPNQANFDQVAQAIQERNAMLDSFFDEKGRVIRLPEFKEVPLFGYIQKPVLKVNGRLRAVLAAPFTWNIEGLRAAGVLPGLSNKKMVVRRATGTLGTDFEADGWNGIPWNELKGIQLNEVPFTNRFKATYDAENLYFAVEAQVDEGMEYEAFGKDGSCWREDCIELMLDPSGQRQSHYHLIANPVANSQYDAAIGFIDDPLNPLYGQGDLSWDGNWSYQSSVKGNTWNLLVVIPFQCLGTKTPAPGDHWTWNVGREGFRKGLEGKERFIPTLMLWSPNLENMDFHSMEAFGDIIFE